MDGVVANEWDITSIYKLLLNREPESGPSLMDRLGKPLDDIFQEIGRSEERRCLIVDYVLEAKATRNDEGHSLDDDLRRWIEERAPILPQTRRKILGATSWEAVQRAIILDPTYDERGLSEIQAQPWVAPVETQDVTFGYRIILGREPENAVADDSRLGRAFIDFVAELFSSREFDDTTVGAAIAGFDRRFDDRLTLLAITWLRSRFGIDLHSTATRGEGLAAVLEAPLTRVALFDPSLPLGWRPSALSDILKNPLPPRASEGGTALTVVERLQSVAQGVDVLSAAGVAPLGARSIRFTNDDPLVILALRQEQTRSAAVEISFAVAGSNSHARPAMYLDYGDGFSAAAVITFNLQGGRRYSAVIAAPQHIKAIRWDPDDTPGDVTVALIAAQAMPSERLKALAGGVPAHDLVTALVADQTGKSAAFELSTRLTSRLAREDLSRARDYRAWIEANEPVPREARRLWEKRIDALETRPTIGVVSTFEEASELMLRETVESVTAQAYPHWELCLVAQPRASAECVAMLRAYARNDDRIHVAFPESVETRSAGLNIAIPLTKGSYLAQIDVGDLLSSDALLAIAEELSEHPNTKMVYSDQDSIGSTGVRSDPFFKPDFSIDQLRSQNYFDRLVVYDSDRVKRLGGWDRDLNASEDFDLNLRFVEGLDGTLVRHVPQILYHRRVQSGSVLPGALLEGAASIHGRRALQDHLDRTAPGAEATLMTTAPYLRTRHHLPSPAPKVSLIIPTRDKPELLRVCVESIREKTKYDNYEIIIADNGSVEAATLELFAKYERSGIAKIFPAPGPFNYSKINNDAVKSSTGEIVGLVNNDIEAIDGDWMRELVSYSHQPRVGCVGAKLYYPSGSIQHAGVVLGIGGVAAHVHLEAQDHDPGYFGRFAVVHGVSAVTGACLFVRREIFDDVGGLDEGLAVAFNDIDFCIRVREKGYTNVLTPFARLIHHESMSRGLDDNPIKKARFEAEVAFMKSRWGEVLPHDPFYSPHLTLEKMDYSLRL